FSTWFAEGIGAPDVVLGGAVTGNSCPTPAPVAHEQHALKLGVDQGAVVCANGCRRDDAGDQLDDTPLVFAPESALQDICVGLDDRSISLGHRNLGTGIDADRIALGGHVLRTL